MPLLTDRCLFTAALLAWAAVALIGLLFGPTLGHDEAAFALTARGQAPPGSWLYRSDGTVAIARIGIALGGAEWQMRLTSSVLNALAIVAVYAVGRAAFSPRTGAWAAAVIAGAHPMVLRSAEMLSDLPAMAGILGGIALLVSELDRDDGPRWRIVLAAPLLAAAFYVRYGSAPVVALALALVTAAWLVIVVIAPIYYRHINDARAPLLDAGAVMREASAGRPCIAVALIVPQLMWYSPCRVVAVGILEDPLPADHARYAASFTRWPIDLPRILAQQRLEATPLPTRDPRAQVWQLH
jgi:4-amino-4-deoxy-L-arabinose transferase-like glycosyltransferase